MDVYLGVDVGSVTTKMVVLDDTDDVLCSVYSRTQGRPIDLVQEGLAQIRENLPADALIRGVGTTGSARHLAGAMLGADVVKNEITSHALGTLKYLPEAKTIFEIGGQDSKIILIRDGFPLDFAMNTVCAAGTGSFLDHQALRLGMTIEEFAEKSTRSRSPVKIAGRCTVFAESDMIHRQQRGQPIEDILYGLCRALVRNYLGNVGAGKPIRPVIAFQGGVASNQGIVRAFEEELGTTIVVPPHHEVMGAIGAAMVAREEVRLAGEPTRFRGFDATQGRFAGVTLECEACPRLCEISEIHLEGEVLARWGARCDLGDEVPSIKGRPM
jgi:predicted CoA-substrate-specific enzyme activase